MAVDPRYCKLVPSSVPALGLIASNMLVLLLGMSQPLSADERQRARCSEKVAQFIPALDKVLTEEENSLVVVQAVMDEYLRFLPIAECNAEEVISSSRRSKFFSELHESESGYSISFYSNSFIVRIPISKDTHQMGFYGAKLIKTVPEAQRAREFERLRASKSATP